MLIWFGWLQGYTNNMVLGDNKVIPTTWFGVTTRLYQQHGFGWQQGYTNNMVLGDFKVVPTTWFWETSRLYQQLGFGWLQGCTNNMVLGETTRLYQQHGFGRQQGCTNNMVLGDYKVVPITWFWVPTTIHNFTLFNETIKEYESSLKELQQTQSF